MSTCHFPIESIEQATQINYEDWIELARGSVSPCSYQWEARKQIRWRFNDLWTEHIEALDRNHKQPKASESGMHSMNWDFDGRLHSIFEFYNLIKRTYGSWFHGQHCNKAGKTIQNHTKTVPPSRPRSSTAETPGCWWCLPLEGTRIYQRPGRNLTHEKLDDDPFPTHPIPWVAKAQSFDAFRRNDQDAFTKIQTCNLKLRTSQDPHSLFSHHLASHPIMPLANKSPWSSVGCVCNNRRLGFLFECSKNHSQKQMPTKKNTWKIPGLRTKSPPGYLHWLYLPDLEAPAVMEKHTRMGIAGLLVFCHICLPWIITESSGMPLMANLEGENGPCKRIKYSNMGSQDCGHWSSWAVGVGVGHFRSEMEKGDKTYKPYRLLISDVVYNIKSAG